MSENYKRTIKKSSIRFFENGMKGHTAIESITDLGNNQYLLKRTNQRPDLKILLADIYIAGEADIYDLDPNLNNIDCIVLIGFYNRYSSAAKSLAKRMNIGLFNNREFFGAVNLNGEKFLDYERKSKDD